MRILISNDDGIYARGIKALANELSKIAEIIVVAPDRDRSGASNSLSVQVPVRMQEIAPNQFSVQGTPTDCVHLGVTGLFNVDFDMVVSGVNHGANLGDDVIYSGTVAAATEGRALGMPSLAISLASKDPHVNFETGAIVARRLIEKLKQSPLPAGTILNVNVPDVIVEDLRGYEITRLGRRHMSATSIKAFDPRGYPVYWIGESGPEVDAGPGTDFHAVSSHKVSITPLQIDMTNYHAFETLSQWLAK